MPKRVRSFRAQLLRDLLDPNEAASYVNAALEDSDEMFLVALRDVTEARSRMSRVANEAGVSRESVYRMLSKSGNPTHSNLRGILKALNLRLSVEAVGPSSSKPSPVMPRSRKHN
jgi:probable addiction module antidote protein